MAELISGYLERDILKSDIKHVLSSSTNQLIEIQSPSNTSGKRHQDERALISDPNYIKSIIVVLVILFNPIPEIRIITVEYVLDTEWDKQSGKDPWLVRKAKCT